MMDSPTNNTHKTTPNKGTPPAMTFGLALDAAKHGRFISRRAWQGQAWAFYADAFAVVQVPNGAKDGALQAVNVAQLVGATYENPTLCLRTGDNKIRIGWTPSQGDMLADDWAMMVTEQETEPTKPAEDVDLQQSPGRKGYPH